VLADPLRTDHGFLRQPPDPRPNVVGAELRGRPPEVLGKVADRVEVNEPRLRHVAGQLEIMHHPVA
jgi:hypothetical protein